MFIDLWYALYINCKIINRNLEGVHEMLDSFHKFDEDERFFSYQPIEPIKIFNYKVEPSDSIINISKSLNWIDVAPILTNYLEWLSMCKSKLVDYFQSKLTDYQNDWDDWFRTIEVYRVDITFLALDDFGATISFGESIFPDHIVEVDFEQFEIVSEGLNG